MRRAESLRGGAERSPAGTAPGRPSTAADVGLVIAAATPPGTFARSLAARSAVDQGIVTGLATGLQYLLTAGTQDVLEAVAELLPGGADDAGTSAIRARGRMLAVDCAMVPIGLAVIRRMPPRPGEPAFKGLARQVAWRFGVTGLGGTLFILAEEGVRRLDARVGAGGRLAAVPLAVPVGLALAYVLERRERPGGGDDVGQPSSLRSLGVAAGVVAGTSGAAYGEYRLADLAARRLATALPGAPSVWRVAGHGAVLAGLGVGASAGGHPAMQRIEAGAAAGGPLLQGGGGAPRGGPPVSGGPPRPG